jgi:hypothetical protein
MARDGKDGDHGKAGNANARYYMCEMISPNLMFNYQFAVECHTDGASESTSPQGSTTGPVATGECWTGQGSGKRYLGDADGIVGPKPRFELRSGWLTLLPLDGWTQTLPIQYFSDIEPALRGLDQDSRLAAMKASQTEYLEAQKEASDEVGNLGTGDFAAWMKARNEAMERALRRRGRRRDLSSYSVFVGEALGKVLHLGDQLNFSRDGNGHFRYCVLRNSEMVFSAGSVGRADDGGPFAVWQEYESRPNPNANAPRWEGFRNLPGPAKIEIRKSYVNARIKDRVFQLIDGQEAHIDPFYVFLARSNNNVPAIAFEFFPRAVHAAGCVDPAGKELIIDAALKMMATRTKTL